MTKSVIKFVLDDAGAELAEYAVAIALLVAIALVTYNLLGQAVVDENNGTAAQVQEASDRTFPF